MKNLLEKISVIISGHTHIPELIEFDNSYLPIQLIIGNGGNDLITAHIPEEKTKALQGKSLKKHFLVQEYGYVVMSNKKKKWLFNSYNRSGGKNLSCTIDTKKSNLNCN